MRLTEYRNVPIGAEWKYVSGGELHIKLKDGSSIREDGAKPALGPPNKLMVQVVSQSRSAK